MKITTTLIFLIFLVITTQAQEIPENANKNYSLNSISIEADVLSGAFSYNRKLKDHLNLGIGIKVGYSVNLSYTESSFYRYNEVLGAFLFNRFILSNIFEVDLGLRWSYIQLVDNSLKHGFSHLDFRGLYATPMIGWKKFKLGTSVGLGWTRDLTTYINPITFRYKVNF